MELFLFGTLWFWIVTSALVTALVTSVCKDSGFFASLFLLITFLFLQFGARIDIIGMAERHPALVVCGVAGYVAIGLAWMVLKWQFLFRAVSQAYASFREKWYEYSKDEHRYAGVSKAEMFSMFPERGASYIIGVQRKFDVRSIPMKVREEYPTLFFWAVYWPISVVITILNDPIRKLFRTLIHGLSGIMQTMSDKEFNKYTELYK